MAKKTARSFYQFPTTRWTLVEQAGEGLSEPRQRALNDLLVNYWPALKSYLVNRRGWDDNDAEDLLQAFLHARVLNGGLLDRADQDRGRFRGLLMKSLDHFASNHRRRGMALKRQADRADPLDEREMAAVRGLPSEPHDLLDAEQARRLLHEVIQRLQAECRAGQRDDVWRVFEGRIVRPIFCGEEPVSYGDLVVECGFKSTAAAQNALVTAKRSFCRMMEAVLKENGVASADIDAEIADLRECLGNAR